WVIVAAVSAKLGLTGPGEPLGQTDRQRRRPVDGQVVQPDEANQATVEARFEDVVAVTALAWLRIERYAPHVVAGAAASLGILDGSPVQQVAGFDVLQPRARATVEVDGLGSKEQHDRPGQQSILETRQVHAYLAPLAKEGEQILVVGAAADGELLAGRRLTQQVVEAVHRRRGFRGLHRDALALAGSDISPGGFLQPHKRRIATGDVDDHGGLVLDRMAAGQRPAGGEDSSLRIRGPFRIDLEDRSSFCRKAFTEGLPEAGPVLQVAVEDRAARRVVQIEAAGKASAQDGGGRDRLAGLHPEVAAGLPAVARFEATPCPGL